MATKLGKQFITTQQKKLQELKVQITDQVNQLKKDDPFSDPEYSSDNAAIDTDVREQDYHAIVEAKIRQLEKRLVDIDHALRNIEKGTYGYCRNCKEMIPVARLELVPEAQYCVKCESKMRK
jgi:RNA polymerase-binding protein DksA